MHKEAPPRKNGANELKGREEEKKKKEKSGGADVFPRGTVLHLCRRRERREKRRKKKRGNSKKLSEMEHHPLMYRSSSRSIATLPEIPGACSQ